MTSSQPVPIWTTPYSYRIQVTRDGRFAGTNLPVGRFFDKFIEKQWSWPMRSWVVLKRYVHYEKSTGLTYVPRYDLERLLELFEQNNVPHEIIPIDLCYGKSVSIPMRDWFAPIDDRQAKVIHHMATSPDHTRAVNLQTGGGKTAGALGALSMIGRRAAIGADLVNQWRDAIFEYTELTPNDVYVIVGAKSIAKLLLQIDKTIHPKIILYSLRTLSMYARGGASYENYPPYDTFWSTLKVGPRVTDESHMNFHANLIMDLRSDQSPCLPLSATMDVSNQFIRPIFHSHYPDDLRVGGDMYIKYVAVYTYKYRLGAGLPTSVFRGKDGYEHARYETWLLKGKRENFKIVFDTVWRPIIEGHYLARREENERCLIFCATVAMCDIFAETIAKQFPYLSVTAFAGDDKDESTIATSDVIIGTPKGCGTGRDIPRLRMVLNTISIRSAPQNEQILGRLRQLRYSKEPPQYIQTMQLGVPSHDDHHAVRTPLLQSRALTYNELVM